MMKNFFGVAQTYFQFSLVSKLSVLFPLLPLAVVLGFAGYNDLTLSHSFANTFRWLPGGSITSILGAPVQNGLFSFWLLVSFLTLIVAYLMASFSKGRAFRSTTSSRSWVKRIFLILLLLIALAFIHTFFGVVGNDRIGTIALFRGYVFWYYTWPVTYLLVFVPAWYLGVFLGVCSQKHTQH